jgi:hypothetical protein
MKGRRQPALLGYLPSDRCPCVGHHICALNHRTCRRSYVKSHLREFHKSAARKRTNPRPLPSRRNPTLNRPTYERESFGSVGCSSQSRAWLRTLSCVRLATTEKSVCPCGLFGARASPLAQPTRVPLVTPMADKSTAPLGVLVLRQGPNPETVTS